MTDERKKEDSGGWAEAEKALAASPTKVPKLRYTHDAMVDRLIAEPSMSQGQLAREFGYTATWVSIVINSDAFRERLAMRRGELVDPLLETTLNDRFMAMAVRATEVIQEKLMAPSLVVDPTLALAAAALGAKALGVGGFSSKVSQPPAPPADDRLNRLADRLTALMGGTGSREVVDIEARAA